MVIRLVGEWGLCVAAAGVAADVETVGNLPASAGRTFFQGLLAASPAPVDMGREWPEVRMVCGGNMGLLRRCHQSTAAYQSLLAGKGHHHPCNEC